MHLPVSAVIGVSSGVGSLAVGGTIGVAKMYKQNKSYKKKIEKLEDAEEKIKEQHKIEATQLLDDKKKTAKELQVVKNNLRLNKEEQEKIKKKNQELQDENKELLAIQGKLIDYPRQPYQQSDVFLNNRNIGITGPSRAGKSTLLNTLMGKTSKDAGAASVRHGVEGTKMPTPYLIKNYADINSAVESQGQSVVLWDCPGHGTENFPLHTYLRDMGLRYFHAIICVTKDVFSEGDLRLLREMEKEDVEHIMVRNKIDVDVKSAIREGDDPKEIQNAIREDLERQGVDEVFLIAAPLEFQDEYDFPEFKAKLIDLLTRGSNRI